MPSSEKIISPGVFTNEIDKTHLPAAVGEIGAALIGPTVKGKAGIPTIVNSYSEFQTTFGDTFKSGSDYYQYLTSYTAKEYLRHGSKLTVVRIMAGSPSHASATISSSIDPAVVGGGEKSSGSVQFTPEFHNLAGPGISSSIGGCDFVYTASDGWVSGFNTSTRILVVTGSTAALTAAALRDSINNSASLHGLDVSASTVTDTTTVTFNRVGAFGLKGNLYGGSLSGSTAPMKGNFTITSSAATIITSSNFEGGKDYNLHSFTNVFKLHTLAQGTILNNAGTIGDGGVLGSGTDDNYRWEIANRNNAKGTFSLLIRRGDDSGKSKQILENWNDLSLDPNESNYIGKVIGTQVWSLNGSGTTEPYLSLTGDYPNKSKYVRVEVLTDTVGYLDENGDVRVPAASASLPSYASGSNSGSFGGSFSGGDDGTVQHGRNFSTAITDANSQGLGLNTGNKGQTAYEDAINLLGNQDEYDINLVLMPGVTDAGAGGGGLITKAIGMCEDRGDCFVVADPGLYSQSPTTAATKAEA